MFCEDNDGDSLKYVHARLDIIEKRLADLTDNSKDSLKELDLKLNGECIATNDMLKFALKQRKINLRQQKLVKLLLGTLHPQMADVVDIFSTSKYSSSSSSSIGVQELLPIPPTVIRPGLGACNRCDRCL